MNTKGWLIGLLVALTIIYLLSLAGITHGLLSFLIGGICGFTGSHIGINRGNK